jgi:hypothetical protein
MTFPDDTFDLVWACESGEHMPDKAAYVKEMTRVLKPGGTLVIATWCQRDETPETPFRCGRRCGPHLGEVLPSAEARSSCGCYSGGGRGRSPEGAGRRSGTLPVVPTTEKPPTHHQPPNNTPPPAPLPPCSARDQERLRFLYEEWAHPYFVSKEEYGRIMQARRAALRCGVQEWGVQGCAMQGCAVLCRIKARGGFGRVVGVRASSLRGARLPSPAPDRSRLQGIGSPCTARAAAARQPLQTRRRRPLPVRAGHRPPRQGGPGRLDAADDRLMATLDLGGRLGPLDRGSQGEGGLGWAGSQPAPDPPDLQGAPPRSRSPSQPCARSPTHARMLAHGHTPSQPYARARAHSLATTTPPACTPATCAPCRVRGSGTRLCERL